MVASNAARTATSPASARTASGISEEAAVEVVGEAEAAASTAMDLAIYRATARRREPGNKFTTFKLFSFFSMPLFF